MPTVRGSRQKLSNRNRADLAGLPRYGDVPTEKTASSSRGVLSTDIPLRMSLICPGCVSRTRLSRSDSESCRATVLAWEVQTSPVYGAADKTMPCEVFFALLSGS